MTTELQERLREDLAHLTSTRLDLGIDPDDLVRAGHRTRAARAIRRAAGGGSLAIAAVLLFVALAPRPGAFSAPAVPAAPAFAPGALTDAAYFSAGGIGLDPETERLEVEVEASGSGWDVRTIGTRTDGVITEKRTVHQAAAPSAVQLAPKVILALLPTRVAWSEVVMKDEARIGHSDFMHVGDLPLTASLVWFDEPTSTKDVAGFLWQDSSGVVRDSLATAIPTVDLRLGTRVFTIYWDEPLDVLGYQSPEGRILTAPRRPPGIYPRLLGEIDPPTGTGAVSVLGDVLPKGASDLAIGLTDATSAWAQAQLGGRTIYVVAVPSAQNRPISSISYTGADGRPVSLRVP